MVEWANEELSVLEGHLAFFKLGEARIFDWWSHCLLYTSDAADE